MHGPGGDVRAGIQGVGLGGPAVAFEGLGRAAEPHKDAAPAHVRIRVAGLDLDRLVVLCKRVGVPSRLREDAPHGRARVCVAGIGRDCLLVPGDRIVAPAEALERLAGDHVPRRRVSVRPVRPFDGRAVQGLGLLVVAARSGPDSADQQEHGRERL